MRLYFSERNLFRAITLAIPLSVMSVPRILLSHADAKLLIPSAFLSLVLIAGAATAWGRCGGLPGLLPPRAQIVSGLAAALVLALVLAPLAYFGLDPAMRAAMTAGDSPLLRMEYPEGPIETLSLILWVAGFQLVFFVAASMSFFARLLHSRWAALAGAVIVRALVAHLQVRHGHIPTGTWMFIVDTAATTALSCWLFARAGLLPPVAFAILVNLRLFLPPWP